MTTAPNPTGYWFYQQSGEEFRSVRQGSALITSNPEVTAGDIIFLWLGGTNSGLKGWAEVESLQIAKSSQSVGKQPDAVARVQLVLEAPILRTEFASYPGLSDAPLIRRPQTGTFFRLSAEQALGLSDFLRTRNLDAPRINSADVLEPIRRRMERELDELRKFIPDAVPSELAQDFNTDVQTASEQIRTGDTRVALASISRLINALGSYVESGRASKSSALAPLDAARARLANDMVQFARFVGPEGVEAAPQNSPVQLKPPPPPPIISSPVAAPAPPLQPAAPPVVEPPVVAPLFVAPPVVAPPPPPPAPAPAMVRKPDDPLYTAWERKDLIGIGSSVNNLARYISHEGLLPPVAIGVFGDWGSGKTFFIRALQSQIALLSSQSRDAYGTNRTTVFCGHTIQIEFNAWHFVESNLWASLAAHIFEQLYAELERRKSSGRTASSTDALYQQFSAYQQALAEQKRIEKLVSKLRERRDQAGANKAKADKSVRVRLDALVAELKPQLGTLAIENLAPADRHRLKRLIGVSNIRELDAAIKRASDVVTDGQTWLGQIRVHFKWWGSWQFILGSAVVLVVMFGLPILISKAPIDAVSKVVASLGQFVALGISAIVWLTKHGRRILGSATRVGGVLQAARERVENQPDEQLDAAKRQSAEADAELTLLNQQIEDQRDRLAKLADDVDPNQLGIRLREFIEARVKSDVYQKHLGLISLVRKDFSSLYDLMRRHQDVRKQPLPEILIDVRNALGEVTKERAPYIERIVLYIDDLDRCPEDKVVEVLQAVHLMLGLPLFVVVVAVDVRWVGQSIRKQYGKLVGWDEERGTLDEAVATATADDYLEKIFQIPYRIHPMEPDTRKLLLGGLLRQPYLSTAITAADDHVIQQELVPKELSLYPEELKSIEELYQAVGASPRRVRRFLDVYRLMRAGMEEGDVQELLAKKYYAIVLALFAMLSGAPLAGPRVLELLRRESMRADDDPETGQFASPTLAQWLATPREEFKIPADEAGVVKSAATYVDQQTLASRDLALMLRRWIPEIARYSFREVRMRM